jgi:hypothetical protein
MSSLVMRIWTGAVTLIVTIQFWVMFLCSGILSSPGVANKLEQQPTVAVSATKGEHMSGSHSTQQELWLQQILIELGLELDGISTTISIDNHGAVDLSKDSHYQ